MSPVWLCSNPNDTDVSVVYGVLKGHFGEAGHSDPALADFYGVETFAEESQLRLLD